MSYFTSLAPREFKEQPAGSIDGSNASFATAVGYAAGTTQLYLNGLAQSVPEDYAEDPPSVIIMVEPPEAGDRLLITYTEA